MPSASGQVPSRKLKVFTRFVVLIFGQPSSMIPSFVQSILGQFILYVLKGAHVAHLKLWSL